jgi:hypothetical protein
MTGITMTKGTNNNVQNTLQNTKDLVIPAVLLLLQTQC